MMATLLPLLLLLAGPVDAQVSAVVERDNSVATVGGALALERGDLALGDALEHAHELESDGVAIRCRVCGATVAYKQCVCCTVAVVWSLRCGLDG